MPRKSCVLILEDGTEFAGYNFGSQKLPVDGEVGMLLIKYTYFILLAIYF